MANAFLPDAICCRRSTVFMIKKSYGYFWVMLLIGAFFAPEKTSAQTVETPPVSFVSFPAPLPEIKNFIIEWYEKKGYLVERSLLDMGSVRLTAEKGAQKFEVFLTPDSPTGVRINWNRPLDDPQVDRLIKEIGLYLKDDKKTDQRLTGEPEAVPEAVLKKIDAVVCIRASKAQDENRFSGFVIDQKGLILSTAHGVQNISYVTVYYNDGRKAKGQVIKSDSRRDLALIQADKVTGHFISLSEGLGLPKMGDPLYGIGCPNDRGATVYSGVMEGLPVKVNGILLFQVNMPIHPGNSGSPVFDRKGHLVSLVKARFKGSDSIGFLLPLSELRAFLEEE